MGEAGRPEDMKMENGMMNGMSLDNITLIILFELSLISHGCESPSDCHNPDVKRSFKL